MYAHSMCLACVATASPEVAVVVGGWATARFGRPVSRVRDALARLKMTNDSTMEEAQAANQISLP